MAKVQLVRAIWRNRADDNGVKGDYKHHMITMHPLKNLQNELLAMIWVDGIGANSSNGREEHNAWSEKKHALVTAWFKIQKMAFSV